MVEANACIGFGFVEIGTVTPLPQMATNPFVPLPADKGIINRMGFNIPEWSPLPPVSPAPPGSSLAATLANKITPNDQAESDYIQCFNALYDYVDYFVVNVSSPNTPGLQELQERTAPAAA